MSKKLQKKKKKTQISMTRCISIGVIKGDQEKKLKQGR